MNTFYFNTGVKPENVSNFPYEYHKKVENVIKGTLCIPFDCDAPVDATLMFMCGDKNLPRTENVIVREVFNSSSPSKYAYFRLPEGVKHE